jgi:lysophospholipase L1-like esterase
MVFAVHRLLVLPAAALLCTRTAAANAVGSIQERPPPYGLCDCPPGKPCPSDPKCNPKDVLWLPLGDSITWGCNGPTIQDCHLDAASYRVPLALALTQHPLSHQGKRFWGQGPNSVGFNITTMGTLTTGPPYVPAAWLKHEGHPGWQISGVKTAIDTILNESLASSPRPPDLVTIHLGPFSIRKARPQPALGLAATNCDLNSTGTNDCDAKVNPAAMVERMNTLLGHLHAACPEAQVFLADVIGTGDRPDMAQCIKDYNKLVPGIVKAWVAKGMKIYFVAAYDAMAPGCGDNGGYHNLCGGHQIHPTSAGYPRMASAFALSILENFKAK